MIKQMPFLGLIVKDLAESTQFYQEKLGLGVNEKESIPNVYTQFSLNGNGAVFALLTDFEVEGIKQNFDAALYVEDVDAAYAHWQAAGVQMVSAPTDMPFGRTFLFRTPDGHILRVLAQP